MRLKKIQNLYCEKINFLFRKKVSNETMIHTFEILIHFRVEFRNDVAVYNLEFNQMLSPGFNFEFNMHSIQKVK